MPVSLDQERAAALRSLARRHFDACFSDGVADDVRDKAMAEQMAILESRDGGSLGALNPDEFEVYSSEMDACALDSMAKARTAVGAGKAGRTSRPSNLSSKQSLDRNRTIANWMMAWPVLAMLGSVFCFDPFHPSGPCLGIAAFAAFVNTGMAWHFRSNSSPRLKVARVRGVRLFAVVSLIYLTGVCGIAWSFGNVVMQFAGTEIRRSALVTEKVVRIHAFGKGSLYLDLRIGGVGENIRSEVDGTMWERVREGDYVCLRLVESFAGRYVRRVEPDGSCRAILP